MSLDLSVQHRFDGFALDAGFTAPEGVTVLFGRSGSGKTTIVNVVAGLLRPDRARVSVCGEVLCDSASGRWVPAARRRIGYVFQDARLFPHLSVRQNLTYGQRFSPAPLGTAQSARIVEMLGLGALLTRRPGALSGGEKQRVAIGRALLSGPRLLLMDEPLASLDEARKAEILPYLERLRDEAQMPLLYVSHSTAEVTRLATTLVLLHEGRVARAGPVADVLSDPELAPMLGVRRAGAFLTGRVARHHEDGLTELTSPAGAIFLPRVAAAPGATLRVRIAAQDVLLAAAHPSEISALNVLSVEVLAVRQGDGPGVMVQLDAGGERLLARITRRSAEALGIAPGRRCYAIVKTLSVAPFAIGENATADP
ncbi:molybdenum ABC transporter ATP-binding protein [Poseidonocella sedimentorum]|uniref:Molybdate transport system ATP-binding protein n=1 Tax=Poseidonocella sedimentorum TaxID=871652 RepID=A0A1I6D557_9RHOB|nr:molybdenum ABC transporter ATP-binding protein [Poseidonocella sedimentorum]SFR00533.1 molybdate transport system ATP-binding protein [Poseidonocella sedimentorum]